MWGNVEYSITFYGNNGYDWWIVKIFSEPLDTIGVFYELQNWSFGIVGKVIRYIRK